MSQPEQDRSVDRIAAQLASLSDGPLSTDEKSDQTMLLQRLKTSLDAMEQDIVYAFESNIFQQLEEEEEYQQTLLRAREIADLATAQEHCSSRVMGETLEGSILGRYEICEMIGSGGMGTVYRAMHVDLGTEVAFKTLPSWRLRNPKSLARFRREMKAVGKLKHPRIVQAHDAGEIDGIPYLVMELVEGLNLSTLIKQTGSLSVGDASEIIRQTAEGLQYIHDQGFIHRDIKPSNIMLTREGEIKIMDLGLAQIGGLLEEEELTKTGQVMGTLDYMAPEQALDSGTVDHRADIYSLGVTFYKLLSGVTPFGQEKYANPLQKTRAMLGQEPSSILEHRTDVPENLDQSIRLMLKRDPAQRLESAFQLTKQVEPFAESGGLDHLVSLLSSEAAIVSAPEKSGRTWNRRGIALVFSLALIGVLLSITDMWNPAATAPVASDQISEPHGSVSSLDTAVKSQPLLGLSLIPAPEGAIQIHPLAFHSGQELLMGGAIQMPNRNPSNVAFIWTQSTDFKVLPQDQYDLIELSTLSSSGDRGLLRASYKDLFWTSDGTIEPVPFPKDRMHICCFGVNNGKLWGVIPHRGEPQSLGVWEEEVWLTDLGAPEGHGDLLKLIGVTTKEQVLCVYSDSRKPTQPGEGFLWSEEGGFVRLTEEFPAITDVVEYRQITSNGRFLCGQLSGNRPFLFDLEEKTLISHALNTDGFAIGVSDDGGVAVGYSSPHGGWLRIENGAVISIRQSLMASGYDCSEAYLQRPFGVSPDGQYVWGVETNPENNRVSAWILDLTQIDFTNTVTMKQKAETQ